MVITFDKETGYITTTQYGQDEYWEGDIEWPDKWRKLVPDAEFEEKFWNDTTQQLESLQSWQYTIDKNTIISDGVDKITFTNLPENAKIYVDDFPGVSIDSSGIFEFLCTDAGTYNVKLRAFGHPWMSEIIEAKD